MDAFHHEMRQEMAQLRRDMLVGFEQLRTELRSIDAGLKGWVLTLFVPVIVGVWGTVIVLLFRR